MTAAQPYLKQLADDVHAYVQPDGGWCLSNAGIVIGGDEVLLVDTAATEARTLALRAAVRSLTDAPVRTVVNTHHHGDHTHGNFIFAGTARIIGHVRCPAAVVEQGEQLRTLWPAVDWGRFESCPPTDTYTDQVMLRVGKLSVQLVHIPPAHTTNDTVVWLPERGVLFTGDLVFSGGTPFLMTGSLSGALEAITRLRDFGAQVVVSGHGPVGGAEILDVAERYLVWLAELAAAGHARGVSPLDLARATDLGEFARLGEPERLVANLHRAYAELDGAVPGAPLDDTVLIGAMAAFHGGIPECCA